MEDDALGNEKPVYRGKSEAKAFDWQIGGSTASCGRQINRFHEELCTDKADNYAWGSQKVQGSATQLLSLRFQKLLRMMQHLRC